MLDAKGNSVGLKEEVIWAKRQPLDAGVSSGGENKLKLNIQDKTSDENYEPNRLNVQMDFVQK